MKTKQRIPDKRFWYPPFLPVFSGVILMMLFLALPAFAQQEKIATLPAEQQQRLDLMKSKGVDASLTILPVKLIGNPMERVSEFVGYMLEQQGLKNIVLSQAAFNPANGINLQALADSLGIFVKNMAVATDYVQYSEMNGDAQQRRIVEVRTVVVDKTGALVWLDSQNERDPAFKQVDDPDPAGFSMLLVQRLSPQLGLSEETARNARPGKMTAIMNERSGIPPENELAPLPDRQKAFKKNIQTAVMAVFPLRVDGKQDDQGAAELVKMINEAGLCKAVQAKNPLWVKSSQEGPNEMKKLWDMARDFRDFVKTNPEDADYLLYADYTMPGYVHFVICDRSGEWVIADLQNSGHSDFRKFDVSKVDGCNRLTLTRLLSYTKMSVADALRGIIDKKGVDAAQSEFPELRAKKDHYLSEEEMNALGYEYLFAKQIKEAIAVFRMNTEAFPGSWNTYDSLGEAYAAAGDKEAAIKNYEKSLKINPQSPCGKEALKKLKEKP